MDLQFLGDNFHSLVYVVFAFPREDHFLPISHLVLSLSFLLSVDCKCWMWLRLCFCVGFYFYCIWIQFFFFFVVILSGFNPSRYLMNMYNGYDSQRLTVAAWNMRGHCWHFWLFLMYVKGKAQHLMKRILGLSF